MALSYSREKERDFDLALFSCYKRDPGQNISQAKPNLDYKKTGELLYTYNRLQGNVCVQKIKFKKRTKIRRKMDVIRDRYTL